MRFSQTRTEDRSMKPLRALQGAEQFRVKLFGYPRDAIHFLHISKTAGSHVKLIIDQVNSNRVRSRIFARAHEVRLIDLPANQRFFFSIRNPISRFVSAFYWRKSKGGPNFGWNWKPNEEEAFKRFEHANKLAEHLFEHGSRGEDAAAAMKSIPHTSRNQIDNFTLRGFLFETHSPVWIIRQESFEKDMREFLRRIGHNEEVKFESGNPAARRQDYGDIPALSSKAKENLRIWYAQDFEFFRLCHSWLEANGAQTSREELF